MISPGSPKISCGYNWRKKKRKWETRTTQESRLTKQDREAGNINSAITRMNTNDGGLAKHSTMCNAEIKWDEARIVVPNESFLRD